MSRGSTFLLALVLAGCGVETAGTASTVATLKAQEVKQGQETREQVVKQLDDMNKQAEQRLKDADGK
jgi:hypothetical protein